MAERLRTEELPAPWKYAVTSDGRVFFINDETRTTTWLHPVTARPVASGYQDRDDLPDGWQEDVTADCQVYFINHYDESTTFSNPVTGRTEMDTEPQDAPQMYTTNDRHLTPPTSHYPEPPLSPASAEKASFKKRTIPKHEAPKVKRREGAIISKDGWLQKKDSSGLGVWRKKWCVVSDFCLFYYKGADAVNQSGTVMLPSYVIKPVEPNDKITKKFAFKCEHMNMRTYYFAADNEDLMYQWIDALNDASQVNLDRDYRAEDDSDWGGSQVRSPRSLRRNEQQQQLEQPHPNDENRPKSYMSARPRESSPSRTSDGSPPRRKGWGNYESIEMDPTLGEESSMRNGHQPERSYEQQSSKESWEGSQPRNLHDNASYASSQDDRRSGQQGRLSPPSSPSLHSASSRDRDRSFSEEKPRDLSPNVNYVDIADIKERKRQNQLEQSSRNNSYSGPHGEPRQQQQPSSRHPSYHDDQSFPGNQQQHPGYRDEVDGVPIQDGRGDTNGFAGGQVDPGQQRGQGLLDPRSEGHPNQSRRTDSYRSNASQRSISEPSQQRGLAPMEEVPVSRVSTERLNTAPRHSDYSYDKRSPSRGREPGVPDRVPSQRSRTPPEYRETVPDRGRAPSQRGPGPHPQQPYGRVPPQHARGPPQHGRGPPQYSRAPPGRGMAPPLNARGPPQNSRGPPPQGYRGPPPRGRAPPGHGRAPPQQRQGPPGSPQARHGPPGSPQARHGAPPQQRQGSPQARQGSPQARQGPPPQHRQGPPGSPQQRHGAPRDPRGLPPHLQGRGPPPQGRAPHHQERMPVQQSRAPQERSGVPPQQGRAPPGHGSMSSQSDRGRSPSNRSASRASTMSRNSESLKRSQSRERGRDRDVTVTDVAPSRRSHPAASSGQQQVGRSDTLKRQEMEKDDEVAPLGARQAAHKTGRYRMWQQKTQQFVDLSTGIRLRLSIAAGDLLGKSHEELVLFLIQLRRDKANLLEWLAQIENELTLLRDPNSPGTSPSKSRTRSSDSLRRSPPNLTGDDLEYYHEVVREKDEVARELDISAPLINLVDNLVRMGSLYGGDNHMIAQEFYGDKVEKGLPYSPPKKLIEFSRRREEEKLVQGLENELKQLQTAEDVELQEKLDQLYELDKRLQEISARVNVLKDEKDKIEHTLEKLDQQITQDWDDKEMIIRIEEQQRQLERQLTRVRGQLAMGTKELEEITAENGRIEHEVALMKSGMEGMEDISREMSADSVKEKLQMEREVNHVQSVMNSLERQRTSLANQMDTLRRTQSKGSLGKVVHRKSSREALLSGPYAVTDLDTRKTIDIRSLPTMPSSPERNDQFPYPETGPNDQEKGYFDPKLGNLSSHAISPGVFPVNPDQYLQEPGESISGVEPLPSYSNGEYFYPEKGRPSFDDYAKMGKDGYNQSGYNPELSYEQTTPDRSGFERSIDDNNMAGPKVTSPFDPHGIESGLYDSKDDPAAGLIDQSLVSAEYSAPSYSSQSFSSPPPQQSPVGFGSSGKGFTSTDLDTRDKYPEMGQALDVNQNIQSPPPVVEDYEEPIQEPIPHPFDREDSLERQEMTEVQQPPLKSPEINSDLTPVGLFHYTSLSPQSFDAPPPKKLHTPRQSGEYQSKQSPQSFSPPPPVEPDYPAPPPPLSSEMVKPYADGTYFASPSPASSMNNIAGVASQPQPEGQKPMQYGDGQWESLVSRSQWDYGNHDNGRNEPTPSEQSFRSDDSRRQRDRKTSLLGPTPFRKTSSVDPGTASPRGFSSVSGVQRRQKGGMDEEKRNRRKSATERLLNSKPRDEPTRDAFSDTEMDPSPVTMAIKPGKSPASQLKRKSSASERLIRSARAKSLPGNLVLPSPVDTPPKNQPHPSPNERLESPSHPTPVDNQIIQPVNQTHTESVQNQPHISPHDNQAIQQSHPSPNQAIQQSHPSPNQAIQQSHPSPNERQQNPQYASPIDNQVVQQSHPSQDERQKNPQYPSPVDNQVVQQYPDILQHQPHPVSPINKPHPQQTHPSPSEQAPSSHFHPAPISSPPAPMHFREGSEDVFLGPKKIHTFDDGPLNLKPEAVWEKALSNDLPKGELERALKTKDDELEEHEEKRKGNYVYKSDLKNVEFDESTGGGLLGIPAKVHIPERYNPATDDGQETEVLTREERARIDEKAKKVAKLLSSQSLQEFHPREILPEWNGRGPPVNDMKQRVEREKELREEVLEKRRALAHEVTQQTKIIAAQMNAVS